MSETPLLTASEAAATLRISTRKMYELAASGKVASLRFDSTVRFDPADIEAYKQLCRLPATTRAAGSSSLTASSPEPGSALTAYFRKAGRAKTPKTTTSEKRRDSTRLQLVAQSQSL